uniref:rRNA methyltransferase 2, mitochondrial n=1 Tax=Culicoides sonorensis TaxID=179676 RepID=A0A336LL47_CULSO
MFKRNFTLSSIALAKVIPKNLKGKSVSSQLWLQRQLSDPYVEKAKRLNYRCRSAFKLIEIDEKYKLLKPGQNIIDCGCSPGSWSQVAVQRTKGLVIGVDLLQPYPLEGAILLGNTNFTTESGQNKIKEILKDKKLNVVLSDMAPKATGVRQLDQENIVTLCYSVLRFALQMSEENASIVMKIWSNGELKSLMENMEKYYKVVKICKPNASRSDSAEQFLVGKGFIGVKTS